MTKSEFEEDFSKNGFHCLGCHCHFLCYDYEADEDTNGIWHESESWWCRAKEGDFCNRLNCELKFEDDKDIGRFGNRGDI